MHSKRYRLLIVIVLFTISSVVLASMAATFATAVASPQGQNVDPKKFKHATDRSADAGRIIATLALGPDSGLPKELMDRAEAVGVFPKVEKETVMFTKISQGYGVISARQNNTWTVPAFYQFSGGSYGNPFSKDETTGLLLLFMTKDSLSHFEKGGVALRKEMKTLEGPVGSISDDQRKELADAQVFAYSFFNGKLIGKSFGKNFWHNFALNPDNNINTPVYGMKGREVLAGKPIDVAKVLSGITAYQEALISYYPKASR